jgi:hypothetical protein
MNSLTLFNIITKPSDVLNNIRDLDFVWYLYDCYANPSLWEYIHPMAHIEIISPFTEC